MYLCDEGKYALVAFIVLDETEKVNSLWKDLYKF